MIPNLIQNQKDHFKTGETKSISFRRQVLIRLRNEVIKREQDIFDALNADFKKPEFESALSETEIVRSELNIAIDKLSSWAKPQRVSPFLINFPATDKIYSEPYGNTLIIGPWNYPYQLTLSPLVGAIAAGNTAIIKPSELTPHTSALISEIISNVFKSEHVTVVEGGVSVSQELLSQRWDYIFFTGSVSVGKIVAKAAAEYLTPVTLELGGKSPCIIDTEVNLKLVAKRLIWGKLLNAGQTCVAPDYVLVHHSKKQELIKALGIEIEKALGKNPKDSNDFARIINTKNFDRLHAMLEHQNIIIGGETDRDDLYVAPTILDEPSLDSLAMQDEVFGPILPILTYDTENDISAIILSFEKPLALSIFSKNKAFQKRCLEKFSFGGGVINDVVINYGNSELPFGGIGHSGHGAYHGKHTFDTFSHKKGITKKGNWFDLPIRYAPYTGKIKLLKFMFRWFS